MAQSELRDIWPNSDVCLTTLWPWKDRQFELWASCVLIFRVWSRCWMSESSFSTRGDLRIFYEDSSEQCKGEELHCNSVSSALWMHPQNLTVFKFRSFLREILAFMQFNIVLLTKSVELEIFPFYKWTNKVHEILLNPMTANVVIIFYYFTTCEVEVIWLQMVIRSVIFLSEGWRKTQTWEIQMEIKSRRYIWKMWI